MSRSSHPSWLPVLLLAMGSLAGCINADPDDPLGDGAPVFEVDLDAFVNPLITDHDHADPALHEDLVWNMVRTGGALLDDGIRGTAAPHALDVKAGRLFVSAYTALGQEAGVWIYDVETDPMEPKFLGHASIPGPGAGDRNMEATADGNFVVLGVEDQDCGGSVQQPGSAGIYLFDTSDPTNPVEVDHLGLDDQFTSGEHSINVVSTEDGDWVYHGGGSTNLYKIDRDTKTLEIVGTFRSGHDTATFWDPLEERLLLLSADVSKLQIYDVSDAGAPELIGGWAPEELGSYYIHTAVADTINGRNIAVVNSEDFMQDPSTFWILDITDPTSVKEISQWFSPDDVLSGDLTFSLHNPRIQDGILTFSYYHGGVWQFDLNDEASWEAPRPRAYYLPDGSTGIGKAAEADGTIPLAKACGALLEMEDKSLDIEMDAIPFTFDVELYGDVIYAADVNTGIHALMFEGDHLVHAGIAADDHETH